MPKSILTPVGFVESVAHLRLPPWADSRLQELMDANNEGRLSEPEREDLSSLVEWTESLSLLKAQAFSILGTRPV